MLNKTDHCVTEKKKLYVYLVGYSIRVGCGRWVPDTPCLHIVLLHNAPAYASGTPAPMPPAQHQTHQRQLQTHISIH